MLTTTPDTRSVSQDSLCPTTAEPEYLSDCSPRDRPWDQHRSQADQVAAIYSAARGSPWLSRLGKRVEECSKVLGFAWAPEKDDSSALTLKLREARFCRVRHCPVCQWRRSLMWIARFLASARGLLTRYPTARFIYLVVSVRTVPVYELGATLREMSKGWDRLRKRKEFGPVLGWIRTVEVTRGENGFAHPHYNALLMVTGDYFHKSEKYVTQAIWTKIWRESLGLDYQPIVYVEAVKSKRAVESNTPAGLMGGVCETLKYAVKPSDMIGDPAWLLELTRQLHKLRFIASGGVLKDMLREKEERNEDLLLLSEGEIVTDDTARTFFDWWRPVRRYKRRGRIQ